MPVEIYRVLHICGILILFSSLAGLWGLFASGQIPARGLSKMLSSLHGLGLLLILVSGFGMAAKLGFLNSFPLWLDGKIAIWLILGGSIALAKRKPQWGVPMVLAWVVFGTAAAVLALLKPF